MIIYPDIELQGGKCVHLWRGVAENPIVHDESPLDAAKRFASEGAQWLNLIDLDRVFDTGDNDDLVHQIIANSRVPVQVGGGIYSIEQVRDLVEAGVGRVVIATAAVKDPDFVKRAAAAYPGQIVVSIDSVNGYVANDGWRSTTAFTPLEFASLFADVPLAGFILTDIDRDIDEPGSNMVLVTELSSKISAPVIASGSVKTLDDISTLKYLPNISGAIIGRALFAGTFTLGDALAIANEPMQKVAGLV